MIADAIRARAALENGEFVPFFQPLVAIRSGELIGFEVLARWNDPEHGLIPPNEFVPAAERDGWIWELTRQLLRQAFGAVALLPNRVELAFNIAALQLHDSGLPKLIADIASEAAFPLDHVCLELTESALVWDTKRACDVAHQLKEAGCKLALDDFGTGYSSLSSLQSLPFDVLKVDRSFVNSMTDSKESRKIVAAVVGLGQSLGITTVAEGIETEAQDEMLLWLGCDQGQGWLYGRPAPAADLAAMIAARSERTPARRVVKVGPQRRSLSELDLPPATRLAQLRAVYDGAPVGLAFLDREMRYVTLNRRLAEMNGPPMEAHLGRTVGEMIPGMAAIVEPLIRRALNGESIPGVEVQKPASEPNGGRTILLSYEPACDEGGEVVGVSVSLTDMTAVKTAEKLRDEAEEHFRCLLDLNPQIPWLLDAEGRALDVSHKWEAATGRQLGSWKGYGWLDSLHPDDVEHTKEVLFASIRSGEPIDVNYRVRPEGGDWTWMRSRGWARCDAEGNVLYWYGILERAKQAEESAVAAE
jgi:PAS domain S-box-containing protein